MMGVAEDNFAGRARASAGMGLRETILRRFRLAPVFLALLAVWVYFSLQNPVFLSPRNLNFLALQVSVTALLALALSFVLIVSEIDLSIAILGAVAAAVGGNLIVTYGFPTIVGIAGAIATGIAISLFHALVVTRLRLASFIVTLGTMLALQGALILLMPADSRNISLVGTDLADWSTRHLTLGQGIVGVALVAIVVAAFQIRTVKVALRLGEEASMVRGVVLPVAMVLLAGAVILAVFQGYKGIPWFTVLVFGAYAFADFFMRKTATGAHLYAVGGNPEAARRAGISIGGVKTVAFVLTGAFCAVAGLVSSARTYGVAFNSGGPTEMLNGVAACIIGGIALSGGRGAIWGVLIGAILMASLQNGLFLNSAPDYVQYMIQGSVLVIALMADALMTGSRKD